MRAALLLTLSKITLCVSAFSQSAPPEEWLGIRGSEPEVLAQVKQLTAGGEYVVTYGEHCFERTGHAISDCREIEIYTDENESIKFIFYQDLLFRIFVQTQQVAKKDTAAWLQFSQKTGLIPSDLYHDARESRLYATPSNYNDFCPFEASVYCRFQQRYSERKEVFTQIILQWNTQAPLTYLDGCGCMMFEYDEE